MSRKLHRGVLPFEFASENDVNNLDTDEVLKALESTMDNVREDPSTLLDRIEIIESLDFPYESVDFDSLLSDGHGITPSMA